LESEIAQTADLRTTCRQLENELEEERKKSIQLESKLEQERDNKDTDGEADSKFKTKARVRRSTLLRDQELIQNLNRLRSQEYILEEHESELVDTESDV